MLRFQCVVFSKSMLFYQYVIMIKTNACIIFSIYGITKKKTIMIFITHSIQKLLHFIQF